MKKIAHIFGAMDYGGAELRTIELMDNLFEEFNDILFITTSGKEGKLAQKLYDKGYKILPCNIYSLSFPIKFYKILTSNNINIVHSHISIVSGYIMLIAKLAKVKQRIVHFRSNKVVRNNSISSKIKKYILLKLIYFLATDIVSVSRTTMVSHYPNYEKDSKMKIIVNGISVSEEINEKEKTKNNKSLKLIHVGRFDEPKNHFKVISIFVEYLKLNEGSKLTLVGNENTPIGKEVIEYIELKRLTKSINLTGVIDNVKEELYKADLLIFPSKWEGLPGVVLESLSVGTPVLASSIPPHLEIQKQLIGIKTLEIEDNDTIWANEISLIHKTDNRKEIAESFKASNYTIDSYVNKFRKLYKLNNE